MTTQRELDVMHVAAQDYLEQVRAEFQQSLMGNRRGMNEQTRRNPGAEAQPVPAATPSEAVVRPEAQRGDDTGAGGDNALYSNGY